jgi:hypothetical protein
MGGPDVIHCSNMNFAVFLEIMSCLFNKKNAPKKK